MATIYFEVDQSRVKKQQGDRRYAIILPPFPMTRSIMSKQDSPIYKVIFLNQGQVYEMYAKQIYQSDLWGFLEIEEFVFGERTQVVVDPSEEKLKSQFEGVLRSFVPMHAIIRIDEVERLGTAKVTEAQGGNVMPFPLPIPGK